MIFVPLFQAMLARHDQATAMRCGVHSTKTKRIQLLCQVMDLFTVRCAVLQGKNGLAGFSREVGLKKKMHSGIANQQSVEVESTLQRNELKNSITFYTLIETKQHKGGVYE